MTNRHGTPIWYKLQTSDPDTAKRFYDDDATAAAVASKAARP